MIRYAMNRRPNTVTSPLSKGAQWNPDGSFMA
jgi:hypothetical protein